MSATLRPGSWVCGARAEGALSATVDATVCVSASLAPCNSPASANVAAVVVVPSDGVPLLDAPEASDAAVPRVAADWAPS